MEPDFLSGLNQIRVFITMARVFDIFTERTTVKVMEDST